MECLCILVSGNSYPGSQFYADYSDERSRMFKNMQMIKLGGAVFGLVLVMVLCTAAPVKADIVRGWVPGTSGVVVSDDIIASVSFANFGDKNFVTGDVTSNANGLVEDGDVLSGIASTKGGGKFTLEIDFPMLSQGATGFLLTLTGKNYLGSNAYGKERLAELFDDISIGVTNTLGTYKDVFGTTDEFTFWFGGDSISGIDDIIKIVMDAPKVSGLSGGFEVKIQETHSPEPGTLAVLGLGLVGLGLAYRRKK